MNEKERRKTKKVWIGVIVFGLVCLLLLTLLESAKINSNIQKRLSYDNANADSNNETTSDYAYETCYAGDPYMPERLFLIPFQKTEDYIMNKELINQLDSENVAIIAERAKSIFVPLFNIVHKDTSNMDSLRVIMQENMDKGFSIILAEDNVIYGSKSCSDRIIGWAMDNGISMEASMQTDKCMVYYDQHTLIVRGMMTFSINECTSIETLSDSFNIENLQLGKDYSVIVEIHMVPSVDRTEYESYNMASFEIL